MTSQRRLRLPAIGVAAIAAATLMTSCSAAGNTGASGGEAKQLTVMSQFTPSDHAGKAWEAAVKGFTAKTGIKIKSVTVGAQEIFTSYETSVLSGKEADIVFANLYDKALTWTDSGATVPVNDYLKKWGIKDTINPAALADWTDSKGRLQGIPYEGFTWPVWYNKALLKQAGIDTVPTTYKDLIADATKLKTAGVTPVAIGGNDWSGEKFFLQLVTSTMKKKDAKEVMSKGGFCASNSAMNGIEQFLELSKAGVFPQNAEGLTSDNMYASFIQKKAAIMPAGSWEFSAMPKDLVPNIELGGFPLPEGSTFSKPTAYQAFTSTGMWLSPNGVKKADAVKKFVKYMYSPKILKSFVTDAGNVPVTKVDNLDSALADQPLLLDSIKNLPSKVDYAVFPDFYIPGAKTQAITTAISTAFASGATAKAVCASLDAAYN